MVKNRKIEKIQGLIKKYGLLYTGRKIWSRAVIKYRLGPECFPSEISPEERKRENSCKFKYEPLISLAVPLYNTDSDMLREMIESVILGQTYRNFQLVLADAGSEKTRERNRRIVQTYKNMLGKTEENKILYFELQENRGISENTNAAVRKSTGEYIALLDHDDILHPSALFRTVEKINSENADMIYSDELSFDKNPCRVQSVHLKPDFSPELLRSNNYICHFTVFSRKLAEKIEEINEKGEKILLRSSFDGSQDYDLFLRLSEKAERISHISDVLYYWRISEGSVASGVNAKPYTVDAGLKAVEEHLVRRGIKGKAAASDEFGPFYRVTYAHNYIKKIICICEDEGDVERVKGQSASDEIYVDAVHVSDFSECRDIVTRIQNYDCVMLLRKGFRQINGSRWTSFTDELSACLEPEENISAGAPVLGKKYVKSYGYGGKGRKFIPEFSRTRVNDPGYMNRLRYRMNISFDYGAVLAVKPFVLKNISESLLSKPGKDIFKAESWYSVYKEAGKKGYSIMTPYTAFSEKSAENHVRSFKLKKSAGDRFFNHWFNKFGKYYFIE